MRVRVDDRWVAGPVADLRGKGVEPEELLRAVRGERVDGLQIDSPSPGPAHTQVGLVASGCEFEQRAALAAAARSRNWAAPQDRALARLEASRPPPPQATDHRALRQQVAEARERERDLREAVAAERGRLRARRSDGEGETATTQFRERVRALSEAETERVAAEQALARAREQRRERRDHRERRLAVTDRIENRRRAARRHLAEAFEPRVERALTRVPGCEASSLTEATPIAARLATARAASLDAPVVLAADRFDGPWAAAAWLGAPVVRV